MKAEEQARQVAAEHFYGKGTSNLGCCSAACKNCEYGGKDYECELCELTTTIAAAIEQAVSEARLDTLREVKKIYDDGGTSNKVYGWLREQLP